MAKKTKPALPDSTAPVFEDLGITFTEDHDTLVQHIAASARSGDNQRVIELTRHLGRLIKTDE